MNVTLEHNRGFVWSSQDGVWTKGYLLGAADGNHEGDALAEHFATVRSPAEFRAKLLAANGSFAVVVARSGLHLAATDRLRSIPLFYGFRDGELHVSDDAYRLRNALGDTSFSERAAAEFLRSGYVVGADTLSPSVKQLQAGEYLACGEAGLERAFYYRHLHGDYLELDEAEHFERLEALSERVFGHLVASAQGRTLIVPLSGGYDSRYIAAMLKRLDYPHVVCYTYGRASSFEVATSRQVAERLGFPWHFVEYTPKKWAWYASAPEVSAYHRYASNLASLPHVQEFLAVRELQASRRLPANAIFVPGFSGDLLGGSFVPPEAASPEGTRRLLAEGLVDYLYWRHLYLDNPISPSSLVSVKAHLALTLADAAPATTQAFVSAAEAWFTEHKVAKFVVNALRAYEVFGYGWRMPLWDNELMEYWYRVPLRERQGDKLYDRFLLERVFTPLDIAARKRQTTQSRFGALRRRLPEPLFRLLKHLYWSWRGLRPSEDINAFSSLSARLYAELRAWRVPATRTPDVNQALALWLVEAARRDFAEDGG